MSFPFVGEIRMFAGNFAPAGWAFCDGSLWPISENEVLFALIGTTYGGDGVETFAMPDLRGRVPVHVGTLQGDTYQLGMNGGVEQVTLTAAQMPAHSHVINASTAAPPLAAGAINITDGSSWVPAAPSPKPKVYTTAAPNLLMGADTIGPSGGSQPHDNMAPYLAIQFIISLFGIFPSQS
ncbi:tail Collar domain-containing protein [Duganella rhizosphaerae]|uniref:phage tail protein n=1 Tax=Duganella rhizosphaerae TaxID=2885763 RepID=UPI0030E88B03